VGGGKVCGVCATAGTLIPSAKTRRMAARLDIKGFSFEVDDSNAWMKAEQRKIRTNRLPNDFSIAP